jgi:hypothetical protein
MAACRKNKKYAVYNYVMWLEKTLLRLYIIIYLVLCTKCAMAQSDSTLLEYYPLQIGNRWEYEDKYEHFQRQITTFNYFSVEVVGDSTMPNQKSYQVLLCKSIPDTLPHQYFYERIDSASLNIYRYDINDDWYKSDEFFIDSLRLIATGGEFIGTSRYGNMPYTPISYLGSGEDTVLNYLTTLQHFYANDMILGFEYWFAKDLGLVESLRRDTMWRNPITLLYAEINGKSYGHPVSVKQTDVNNKYFRLYQNFPNPFNPSTTIQYELSVSGEIELGLYNPLGQKVLTLFKGFQSFGFHSFEFQAEGLSSGVYIYELRSGSFGERKKLLILR